MRHFWARREVIIGLSTGFVYLYSEHNEVRDQHVLNLLKSRVPVSAVSSSHPSHHRLASSKTHFKENAFSVT